jgi:hypothetical protein
MTSKQSDSKSDSKIDHSEKLSHSSKADSDNPEFHNVGYSNWLQLRREWLTKKQPVEGDDSVRQVVAKSIDVDDVVERIYSNASNGVLKEPIPLGQMIDLLIDFWEADGLYD